MSTANLSDIMFRELLVASVAMTNLKHRRLTRRIPGHFSKAAYHVLCLFEKIPIIGVEIDKMNVVQDLPIDISH